MLRFPYPDKRTELVAVIVSGLLTRLPDVPLVVRMGQRAKDYRPRNLQASRGVAPPLPWQPHPGVHVLPPGRFFDMVGMAGFVKPSYEVVPLFQPKKEEKQAALWYLEKFEKPSVEKVKMAPYLLRILVLPPRLHLAHLVAQPVAREQAAQRLGLFTLLLTLFYRVVRWA